MNNKENILRHLSVLRPFAKFVHIKHSNDFVEHELEHSYYYVNMYDEKIDSNIYYSPYGLILLKNTYLPSFAYNTFLYWLLCTKESNQETLTFKLTRLLKYNFKKFYSEQLYRKNNNRLARTLLIETLLFEQGDIRQVSEEITSDIDKKAKMGVTIMSHLISLHELGHFILNLETDEWEDMYFKNRDLIQGPLREVSKVFPNLEDESKCDTIAVYSCLRQFSLEMGLEFVLRTIVFTYAVFAVLSSLEKSAEATAKNPENNNEVIDLDSFEKVNISYQFKYIADSDFIERTKFIIRLCQNIADREGVILFQNCGSFYLPHTILSELSSCANLIFENEDQYARDMSTLIAEALQGYPKGMEYLYLRSKTFFNYDF